MSEQKLFLDQANVTISLSSGELEAVLYSIRGLSETTST